MCGRYNILPDATAWADVGRVLGDLIAEELSGLPPRHNVAPTDLVPIIISNEQAEPVLIEARWGFIPDWWSKPTPPPNTTNARSETAATLGMWKQAWRHQRCLIPASGWYEWFNLEDGSKKVKKVPHHLRRQDGKQIIFAGLWSVYQAHPDAAPLATCTIVTIPSPPDIADIHERAPVVLSPDYWRSWIDPDTTDPDAVMAILHEGAVEHFSLQTVSTTVSNARNKEADCLTEQIWPEMAEQGSVHANKEQLRWLRQTEAGTLTSTVLSRLGGITHNQNPNAAERRMWIREIGDRKDSDALTDLIEAIKDTLRVMTPKKVKPESLQGSLF